jgi:RNA-binding proteins (RRM domain)
MKLCVFILDSSSYSHYSVVVKSLAKKTEENTIFHNFKEFGKIIPNGVTLLKYPDGKSRCMAFVNYVELDGAKMAARNMDGKNIDGNSIHVELKQKERKDSEKEDYQPITDCKFFMEGECTKKV